MHGRPAEPPDGELVAVLERLDELIADAHAATLRNRRTLLMSSSTSSPPSPSRATAPLGERVFPSPSPSWVPEDRGWTGVGPGSLAPSPVLRDRGSGGSPRS